MQRLIHSIYTESITFKTSPIDFKFFFIPSNNPTEVKIKNIIYSDFIPSPHTSNLCLLQSNLITAPNSIMGSIITNLSSFQNNDLNFTINTLEDIYIRLMTINNYNELVPFFDKDNIDGMITIFFEFIEYEI